LRRSCKKWLGTAQKVCAFLSNESEMGRMALSSD
jgi:hypothetical protein